MSIIPAPRVSSEYPVTGPTPTPPCPKWCVSETGHDLFAVDGIITRLHVGPSITVGDLAVGLDGLETIEPHAVPGLAQPTVTLSGPDLHHGLTELTPAAATALAAALATTAALATGASR